MPAGRIGQRALRRVAREPYAVGGIVGARPEVGEATLRIERPAGQGISIMRPGEVAAVQQFSVVIEQPAVGRVEVLLRRLAALVGHQSHIAAPVRLAIGC